MIVFAEEALDDLERIFEFNFQADPATALDHINKIRGAMSCDSPAAAAAEVGST